VITATAPGKLYIAGEYAVMEPGHQAVLVAVDRLITAHVESSVGGNVDTDSRVCSDITGAQLSPLRRHGRSWSAAPGSDHHGLRYVLAAITIADRFLESLGKSPAAFDLRIESTMRDAATGRKLGLGSSGAVTVAVIRALTRWAGVDLGPLDLMKLGLLASASVNPQASGGDIAAAACGGWIRYSAPSRTALATMIASPAADVAAVVAQPWLGLSVEALPPPQGLRLATAWTGISASTDDFATRLQPFRSSRPYRSFVADSAHCVDSIIDALRCGRGDTVSREVRRAHSLLSGLDECTGLGIVTPELETLCAIAEDLGAAAKSSGAGGGDCGLALVAPDTVEAITTRWRQAGLHPLDLGVFEFDTTDRSMRC
jgi:phosphomevalonate kinase